MSEPNNMQAWNDDELIRRHIDNRLSEEEFREFEKRLCDDARFRKRYIILADLEAGLRDANFSRLPDRSASAAVVAHKKMQSSALAPFATLTALIVVAAFVFSASLFPPPNVNRDRQTTAEVEVPAAIPKHVIPADAAVVTYVSRPGSSLKVGNRIKPGPLSIPPGTVQIEFMCGAQVVIAGPAELFLESGSAATLYQGRAAALVPHRAQGFVLNSPTAAVYDLGTEFGVNVDEKGLSEVAVHSGEVELSLLGDDGNTRVTQRVTEEESYRVEQGGLLVETNFADPRFELRVEARETPNLLVSAAYSDRILSDGASGYWRFEGSESEVIANEIDGGVALKLVNPEQGIKIHQGAAVMERSQGYRHCITETPLQGINQSDFSIEFWMNPADLTHATPVGLFPAADTNAKLHLSVIEIVTDTFMKHEPGALRFLYRSPPGKNYNNGVNTFSSGVLTPGLWHHVVSVRRADRMQMFLNGSLVRESVLDAPTDDDDFHLILGQLRPRSIERQYAGSIDEVALYNRGLDASEVAAHYRAIADSNASVSTLR